LSAGPTDQLEKHILEWPAGQLGMIGYDVAHASECRHLAAHEYQYAAANLLDQVQQVGAEKHGAAGFGSPGDRGSHLPYSYWIKPCEWLVQQEGLGLVQQSAGNRKLLPHTS
jgi:hypothetical protein